MIMATITFNSTVAASNETAEQPKTGLWTRFMTRMVERETAKARYQTAHYLTRYSDAQLAKFGWSEQEIKRLRSGV